MLAWKTEKRKVSDLIPAKYNPRTLSDKQSKDLSNSIQKFSLADPIIINKDNKIIGGHQRIKILKDQGIVDVDVRVPDRQLSEKEEEELNLRLNKNVGEWDWDLLAKFDEDMLLGVGFDSNEMDLILGVDEDDFNVKKEIEKIKGNPVTKKGDLYQLGDHKLLCGDSTNIESYRILFNKIRAKMIFTDPPYNVDYSYDWRSGLHKGKTVEHNFFNDKKSDKEYYQFIKDCFLNAYKFSFEDTNYYCWYANKFHHIVRQSLIDGGWHFSQVIIWIKNYQVLSPGQDFHRTFEPYFHGWKKGKKHFYNKIGNYKDIVNHEEYEELLSTWYENRDKISTYQHPTQKPLRLAERAIKKSSVVDDIVLDMFGGSGSTLLACEQLKRKCFTIELDPIYCDVIVKRWEQFTNKKVTNVTNLVTV